MTGTGAGTVAAGPPPGSPARVARNAVFKVAVQATRLLSLAFLVLAARLLGPERFGQFTFAYTLATLLGAALDLGMHALLVRSVARAPAETAAHWSAAVTLKGILLVPAGALLVLVPVVTGRSTETAGAVWLLGVALVLQSFIELAVSIFTGFERVEVELGLRVVEKLVLLGVGLGGLALGGGLWAVCGAFAAGAAVSLILAVGLVHRRFARLAWRWEPAGARALARALGPVAVAFVLWLVATRLPPLVVALLAGDAAAGYLGAAIRVLEVVLVVPVALAAAVYPVLARTPSRAPAFRRLLAQAVEVLVLLGLPVALAFWAGAEWIIRTVFGRAYGPAAPLLGILGAAAGLGFINAFLVPVFLALDRPRRLLGLAALACVASAGVGPGLVRALGAQGGAITLVLLDVLMLAGAGLALRPLIGVPVGGGVVRSLAAASGATALGLAVPAAGPWRLGVVLGGYGLGVVVLRAWPDLAWGPLLRGLLTGGRGPFGRASRTAPDPAREPR